MLEVLEGKRHIEKLWGDETNLGDGSMDTEGYAWFDYENAPMPDGRIQRDAITQLWVIKEDGRKLLKIDINCIGPPRSRGWYDLCCIRAIPGDSIYFLAWGGRQENLVKANNFKIIKYSWDGDLERITAGILPFTFITEGDPLHYYAKLQIGKEAYSFSVLEVLSADDHPSYSIHASKEYKFRIPIK